MLAKLCHFIIVFRDLLQNIRSNIQYSRPLFLGVGWGRGTGLKCSYSDKTVHLRRLK